jgi:(2R)-sulfolactate sulfo-lyase subunit alpha
MASKFLVHAKDDYVGVAAYDIKRGEEVEGVFLDNGKKSSIKATEDISLGHKISLRDIKKGEKIIEYGEPIGQATNDIKKGDHVHVHNIKTMRWQ